MQSNTYLKYYNTDGKPLNGETTATDYKDMITVLSVDWSVGREITSFTGTQQDREASSARLYDMTITKLQDKTSTLLFEEATIGQGGKAEIYVTKQGKDKVEEIIKIELKNTMISNYSMSVQGDRPVETITISYTKMVMAVTPTNDDNHREGQLIYGYDGSAGQKM
ncbi:Hcp family type VI secretion system effector [Photobacterium sp. J15]|uniref:Hcp family type VI secretion system effector n=1 Tax=Photobacterium sp. J15 TaxID=265901 RepID=UPI0007E385E7|nr:type VI secretion system tube protein Hcp [Photobacterium sp. J15]